MKCKIQRCPSEAVSVVTVPSARGAIDCAYCDVHTLGALRAGATMTDREPTESPPEPPKQPATSDPAGGIVISDVAAQATQDAEAPACSKAGDPGTPFEAPDALTVEPGEPDRTLPAPVGPAPSPTSPQVVPMPAAYPPKCQIPGCDNLARGAKVGRVCKTCQWRSHTLWGVWTPTADQIVALPDAWAQRVAARHYGPVPPPVVAHADAPPEAVNAPTAPKAGRDGPKMGDNRRVVELRAEVNRLTAALEASNARNLVTIESVGRLERERDEARAVIEQIRTDPTPDDGLADESIEACKILGIDTTQDYDYLGSLRAIVDARDEWRNDCRALRERLAATAAQLDKANAQIVCDLRPAPVSFADVTLDNIRRALGYSAAYTAPELLADRVAAMMAERDDFRERVRVLSSTVQAPGIHGPATALREFLAVLGALPVGTVGATPEVQAAGKAMDAADRDLVNAAFVSVSNDAVGQIDRKHGLEAFASSRDARACRVMIDHLIEQAVFDERSTIGLRAIAILLGLDE